jgi:hypothetical protein
MILTGLKSGTLAVLLVFVPACRAWQQIGLEETLSDTETEYAVQVSAEALETWLLKPLDLNRAGAARLEQMPFLPPGLAAQAVEERKRRGPFQNLDDFRKRMRIDSAFSELLRPYVRFSAPGQGHDGTRLSGRIRLRTSIPEAEGYGTGAYKGAPHSMAARMRLDAPGKIQAGFGVEKDPGEPRWNDSQTGFIQASVMRGSGDLTAGTFAVENGQGLVFWSPYALSASADPVSTVHKRPRPVRGIASSAELGIFNGAALSTNVGILQITGMLSNTRLDASLNPDGTVRSLPESGLHRTAGELEAKDRLTETLAGWAMAAHFGRLRAGAAAWWNRYANALEPEPIEKRPFEFRGRKNAVFGLNGSGWAGPFEASWEWARSVSGGCAWIVNFSAMLGSSAWALSVHRYDPAFQNPHAKGYGDEATRNETGYTLALRGRGPCRSRLDAYWNLSKRPGRTVLHPFPSWNSELAWNAEIDVLARATLKARLKVVDGETGNAFAGPETGVGEALFYRHRLSLRIDFRINPDSRTSLRTRIESVRFNTGPGVPDRGLLMQQDINAEPVRGFRLAARWTTFDSNSWESRVSSLETDFPGALSLVTLDKKGHRAAVSARWRVVSGVSLSVKWGKTTRVFSEWSGSGNDRVPGNVRTDWAAQIEWNESME